MIEEIKKAETDIEGLLSVLADNLYSTPVVVIRELIQNSHDAITRRGIESSEVKEPRIDIRYLIEDNILEVSDNGSGLTKDEIERFLATIARGYTRTLRQKKDDQDLIGFFGLGFLSTYVVSKKVEFITCSYQNPDETWCFTSRNAITYTIKEAPERGIGSTVRLHLKDNFDYLSDFDELYNVIRHYCALLDVPIHLSDSYEPVNHVVPPWKQDTLNPIRRQKELMSFCREVSRDFEPLCVIEIPEGRSISGVLWLHDTGTYGTSDNRRMAVYLRGMLLAENDRDLLPSWAGFVSGIINSTTLTPTASRETLKKDKLYYAIQQELKEVLIEGLLKFSEGEPETWRQILRRHNEALRGASLADDTLFAALHDKIKLSTQNGEYTIPQLLDKSEGNLYISLGDEGSAEEVLFSALNMPIVKGYIYASLAFCTYYKDRFNVPLVVLGSDDNESQIFKVVEATEETSELFDLFVDQETEEGILARFEPAFMPLVKIPNREAILKHEIESDEADQRMSQAVLSMARQAVKKIEQEQFVRVYINLSSPIIQAMSTISEEKKLQSAAIIRSFCDIPITRDTLPLKLDKSPYHSFFENLLNLLNNNNKESVE